MKKYRGYTQFLIVVSVSVMLAALAYGVGSITETKLVPSHLPKWEMHKITLDWLSDSSGDVNGINTTYPLDGLIYRVVTIPDTAASGTAPDSLYDIVLLDDDDVDVLNGAGADEPNTTGSYNQFCPIIYDDDNDSDVDPNYVVPIAVHGMLELQVSNAGNANGGKVIIYWK